MKGRIVIMAGGTGGHVFPALAVAQEMQDRGWQVSWLGTGKGLEYRVAAENGIEIDLLTVDGIRGKRLLAKITAVFKLIQACRQAWRILRNRNPNVVLGMGGFVAGPGGLVTKLLGKPLVIHEQNRVPGTTNLLLVKLAASKVLEAFPHSFAKSVNAICTGNPLRKAFVSCPEKLLWHPQAGRPLHLLVVGGSQGAKVLNELVPEALAVIPELEIKHQTGAAMQAEVLQHYQSLGLQAEVTAFIDNIAADYQWADLIICRAGAMTVSEVSAFGLPAIFIPLLNAIDDHQTANARFLSDAGAAFLLPQLELNVENLSNLIKKAKLSLSTMSQAAKNAAKIDATKIVADICMMEAA